MEATIIYWGISSLFEIPVLHGSCVGDVTCETQLYPAFKLKKYTMVIDSHHGNACCKPKSQIPNPYPQSIWNLRAIQTSEPLNPKPKSQSVSCLALLRIVSYFSFGRSMAKRVSKQGAGPAQFSVPMLHPHVMP